MNELQELAAEISNLRLKFSMSQGLFKSAVDTKQKLTHDLDEAYRKARDEYQAQLLKIEDERKRLRDEVERAQLEMDSTHTTIEEKNAAYAKLLQLQNENSRLTELKAEIDLICEGFDAYFKAHVYQHDDLMFTINAYDQGRNGILNANDLGLGKTFESIVSLYILKHKFEAEYGRKPRILWLTKKTLVKSTPKEIRTWWPKVAVFTTETCNTVKDREYVLEVFLMAGDIMLTNYETIRTTTQYANIDWDLIVIDEVHKLKGGANVNGATALWTACKEVCARAKFTIMLSGTPMVNRPQEMWSYLHIFSPEKFPDVKTFEKNFMEYKMLAGEYQLSINANKLLEGALKGQMIRRSRADVGLNLPEFTATDVELQMNPEQAIVYEQMRKNFFVWLDSMQTKPLTAAAIIAQLTRLRQINVWPAGIKIDNDGHEIVLDIRDSSKIDDAMDKIQDAADQVVVFSNFNEPLREIQNRCAGLNISCEVINGETVAKMGQYENDFQQGKLTVLCLNSSMGEGLNLQKNPNRWPGGSAIGIHLDQWWNSSRKVQCDGRIWRQGASIPVVSYNLVNENSIDAFIAGKSEGKDRQFESIMESDTIRPATEWRDFLEGVI